MPEWGDIGLMWGTTTGNITIDTQFYTPYFSISKLKVA